jgi:hypothetical protein
MANVARTAAVRMDFTVISCTLRLQPHGIVGERSALWNVQRNEQLIGKAVNRSNSKFCRDSDALPALPPGIGGKINHKTMSQLLTSRRDEFRRLCTPKRHRFG